MSCNIMYAISRSVFWARAYRCKKQISESTIVAKPNNAATIINDTWHSIEETFLLEKTRTRIPKVVYQKKKQCSVEAYILIFLYSCFVVSSWIYCMSTCLDLIKHSVVCLMYVTKFVFEDTVHTTMFMMCTVLIALLCFITASFPHVTYHFPQIFTPS